MPFIERNGLRWLQFDSMKFEWLEHGIFTRRGGVSQGHFESLNVGATVGDEHVNVVENKRRIFETLERPQETTHDIWQVHSANILVADQPRQGEPYPQADGLISRRTSVTLSMRFADCVPIMLVDPENHAIGLLHAGWQGTLGDVAAAGVAKMATEFGSDPMKLIGGIGPAIRRHHYPVGQEVFDLYKAKFKGEAEAIFETHNGTHHLDLIRANTIALGRAGVTQIEDAEICTACNLDDWFSHRGQSGNAGRFAGVMGLIR